MLEEQFEKLYLMFRTNYYRELLCGAMGPGGISASESFCAELIYLLKRPTVSSFARHLGISVPNANYKINALVKKGYVTRVPCPTDQRVVLLEVTDKFLGSYGLNNQGNALLMQRIRTRFTEDEVARLEDTIERVTTLMDPDPERTPT